jgi:hypothetical protein
MADGEADVLQCLEVLVLRSAEAVETLLEPAGSFVVQAEDLRQAIDDDRGAIVGTADQSTQGIEDGQISFAKVRAKRWNITYPMPKTTAATIVAPSSRSGDGQPGTSDR